MYRPTENSSTGIDVRLKLLDLAMDCTLIIGMLGRSLEYKSAGEEETAEENLIVAHNLIEQWVDDLEDINVEKIDRDTLVDNLVKASRSLELVEHNRLQ